MDIVTLGAAIGAAKKNLNNVVAPVSASDAGKIATVDSNGKYVAAELEVGQGEVAVDSTLLVTGAAADAKVTGDKVAELKSAISDLFDVSTTWSDGFFTNSNAFNSDSHYRHSDYIAIKTIAFPIHYNIKTVNTVPKYVLFDENKNFIKKYIIDATSLTVIDDVITDFEGAAYIVFETFYQYAATLSYCDLQDAVIRIPDNSISQESLTFAEHKIPTNLFDYKNSDNCIRSTWYYSTTVGSTVSPVSNSNTTPYVAIKIQLFDGIEKVAFGIYPNVLTRKVFWVGAVDADMKLITYQVVDTQPPVTYTIPSRAAYLLVSYNLSAENFDAYIPTIMAVSGETITGYSPYFDPYYLLENCRTGDGPIESNVKLMLPDSYDVVVNDTIQIFYKGIIKSTKPELYDVTVQCANGSAYSRYFEMTPTTTGNISATFTLYDSEHNVIDTKAVTFAVKAAPTNPGTQKNVLCVGDSLTTGGVWPVELHRRLTGSGGTPAGNGLNNINFIGTRVYNGVHYEGYGGWTFNSYNTANVSTNAKVITCTHDKTEELDQHSIYKDANNATWKLETIETGSIKIIAVSSEGRDFPSTGTLTWVSGGTNHSDIVYTASANAPGNPFWDTDSSKVDFDAYATEQGVSSIDYVLVLLGWNSAASSESDYKTAVQTFITNVHESFPNAKVILMGLEIPARDGLGTNYGATGTYSNYYGLMQYVFNVDEWYREIVGDNSNVYSANLSGQFDTEYNMPTGTRQVNTRNSETITYQSNGVHPATPGYYQIADAFYRKLIAIM